MSTIDHVVRPLDVEGILIKLCQLFQFRDFLTFFRKNLD